MMLSLSFSRFIAALMIVISTSAMLLVSFDAEARRFGGGFSSGRQSSNIMQNRQATTPPAARSNAPAAQNTANAGRNAAAQGGRRGGMMGMLGGLAAGLGLAMLFNALGLSEAMASMFTGLLMIGLLAVAAMFIFRMLRRSRGGSSAFTPATATANNDNHSYRQAAPQSEESFRPQASASAAPTVAPAFAADEAAVGSDFDQSWYIPADFDTPGFLANAKERFVDIQALWDKGDIEGLREYVTDDLLAEIAPQVQQREGENLTEVVLLNAELMGIETVAEGYLASVRYSGMLREEADAEAFRFEEVWNLYKQTDAGWLVAGIQQISNDAA